MVSHHDTSLSHDVIKRKSKISQYYNSILSCVINLNDSHKVALRRRTAWRLFQAVVAADIWLVRHWCPLLALKKQEIHPLRSHSCEGEPLWAHVGLRAQLQTKNCSDVPEHLFFAPSGSIMICSDSFVLKYSKEARVISTYFTCLASIFNYRKKLSNGL